MFAQCLAAALLLASASVIVRGDGQSAVPFTIIRSADFVVAPGTLPPPDSAMWMRVSLPDDWRRLGHNDRLQGWYRIEADLQDKPRRPVALHIRHLRSSWIEVFANGALCAGSQDLHGKGAQGTGFAVTLTIAPSMLRAGINVVHVRMVARAQSNPPSGLGPVAFGDSAAVHRVAQADNEISGRALRVFFGGMLASGMIAFFLWWGSRSDAVLFWFSMMCLSWAAAAAVNFYVRWSEWVTVIRMFQQYMNHGLPVLAAIVCLRSVGLHRPKLETLLWGHLVFIVTFPSWWTSPASSSGWEYLRAAGPLVALLGGVIVWMHAPKPLGWSHRVEVVAMLGMALLFTFDYARVLGIIPLDSHNFRSYHVPLILLAFSVAILERHVAALWRIQHTNEALQRMVAEKAREIEVEHARVAGAERERSLAGERQRILSDMHDGLGASLTTLLHEVRSGTADRADIELRVREALQEMRISIDALQPHATDLAALLGNLRYRMEEAIVASGITLAWDVEELPDLDMLTPSNVFDLQRLLLEAIVNVLKHAQAKNLSVQARALGAAGVEIVIEDDGAGFDPCNAGTGRGLANLRMRAERIGARLQVSSRLGKGTRVQIILSAREAGRRVIA